MKKILLPLIIILFAGCEKEKISPEPFASIVRMENKANTFNVLPRPDHIIFVWMENKGYSQIIGSSNAPFINSLLSEGTLFTNAHALGHPSYPEYIRFFAGSRYGISLDACISGTPFSGRNLYTSLNAVGKRFAWYSEDLPATGSTTCSSGYYREKHNPVTVFSNVPASRNKRFADFPTTTSGWETMEHVVCISPNLINDMHNGTIAQGDAWLESHFSGLIDWCKTHNSIFVVYFDEDNGTMDNRIPVIMVGEHVKDNYRNTASYDHYNFTRTILSMYGAEKFAGATARVDIGYCWN